MLIGCQFDPWEELGVSDWVEIKSEKRTYAIGTNNNYKELYVLLIDTVKDHLEEKK